MTSTLNHTRSVILMERESSQVSQLSSQKGLQEVQESSNQEDHQEEGLRQVSY